MTRLGAVELMGGGGGGGERGVWGNATENREIGYPVNSTIDDILAGRHLALSS